MFSIALGIQIPKLRKKLGLFLEGYYVPSQKVVGSPGLEFLVCFLHSLFLWFA